MNGSGVLHSEYNASADEPLTFLQIWIVPRERDLQPGYAPPCTPPDTRGEWIGIAGPDDSTPLRIHQDARLLLARLDAGRRIEVPVAAGRLGYLHAVRGTVAGEGGVHCAERRDRHE